MRQLKNFTSKNDNGKSDTEALNEVVGKYGGMSEDMLFEELLKNVRKQKAEGVYSPEQTEQFVKMISPHLNQAQRQKLKDIVRLINDDT